MSNNSPAAVSNNFNINTIFLPIINNVYSGINIANIQINNNFLDINLNAIIGPNSSISIIKPGVNPTIYKGNVNTKLHLGSDIFNKIPFYNNQTINIILNAAPNETITINSLNYTISKQINYKNILFIFLIVFFVLINIFL